MPNQRQKHTSSRQTKDEGVRGGGHKTTTGKRGFFHIKKKFHDTATYRRKQRTSEKRGR